MTLLMTAAFAAGITLLSFGAWLAYRPAGFITGGFALVLVSLLYIRGNQTG